MSRIKEEQQVVEQMENDSRGGFGSTGKAQEIRFVKLTGTGENICRFDGGNREPDSV